MSIRDASRYYDISHCGLRMRGVPQQVLSHAAPGHDLPDIANLGHTRCNTGKVNLSICDNSNSIKVCRLVCM
jgi:hypothetical protein